MTVYIVEAGYDYEGGHIKGVYSIVGMAEECVEELKKIEGHYRYDYVRIVKRELNDGLRSYE